MSGTDHAELPAGVVRLTQLYAGLLTAVLAGLSAVHAIAGPADVAVPLPLAFGFAFAVLIADFFGVRWVLAAQRRKIRDGTFVYPPALDPGAAPPPPGAPEARFHTYLRQAGDTGKLWSLFFWKVSLEIALYDLAVCVLVLVWWRQHVDAALVLAFVLLVPIVGHFPTRARTERWVEAQRRRLEHERWFDAGEPGG